MTDMQALALIVTLLAATYFRWTQQRKPSRPTGRRGGWDNE